MGYGIWDADAGWRVQEADVGYRIWDIDAGCGMEMQRWDTGIGGGWRIQGADAGCQMRDTREGMQKQDLGCRKDMGGGI